MRFFWRMNLAFVPGLCLQRYNASARDPAPHNRFLAATGIAPRRIWLFNPTNYRVHIVYAPSGKAKRVESVRFPGSFEIKIAQVCTLWGVSVSLSGLL